MINMYISRESIEIEITPKGDGNLNLNIPINKAIHYIEIEITPKGDGNYAPLTFTISPVLN